MADADATASVSIVDDRVAMSADGDVDVYVEQPDNRPLSAAETHATLRIVGNDYKASLELDADALHALAGALDEEGDA